MEKATIDHIGLFIEQPGATIQLRDWAMSDGTYGLAYYGLAYYGLAYVGEPAKFTMGGYSVGELREIAAQAGTLVN